jgi:predicted dehydrogenase
MPVKLGFIGFGIMGERLMRAALQHDRQTITVSGVYDPSSATAARLAAIDPALVVYPSAEAAIAASDCLHIASPPGSHLTYLEQCAAAGRAALCEKPLATDIAAASAAVDRLVSQGMRAAVNFPFASSPAVDQLAQWIGDGAIGEPQRIDIELAFQHWPRSWQMDAVAWLDAPQEGGFTREVASHFLFLSTRFFGGLQLLSAEQSSPEPTRSERAIRADLLAGEVPVRLVGGVGTTTKDDHNTWTLHGSAGRVRLRDWSFAEHEATGQWLAPANAMANEKARSVVLARQLDKIAAMTRGGVTDLATLREALDVARCVETILRG